MRSRPITPLLALLGVALMTVPMAGATDVIPVPSEEVRASSFVKDIGPGKVTGYLMSEAAPYHPLQEGTPASFRVWVATPHNASMVFEITSPSVSSSVEIGESPEWTVVVPAGQTYGRMIDLELGSWQTQNLKGEVSFNLVIRAWVIGTPQTEPFLETLTLSAPINPAPPHSPSLMPIPEVVFLSALLALALGTFILWRGKA